MKKISEKDLTDYLSFLSDFIPLSKKLLSFIPIPACRDFAALSTEQ